MRIMGRPTRPLGLPGPYQVYAGTRLKTSHDHIFNLVPKSPFGSKLPLCRFEELLLIISTILLVTTRGVLALSTSFEFECLFYVEKD